MFQNKIDVYYERLAIDLAIERSLYHIGTQSNCHKFNNEQLNKTRYSSEHVFFLTLLYERVIKISYVTCKKCVQLLLLASDTTLWAEILIHFS